VSPVTNLDRSVRSIDRLVLINRFVNGQCNVALLIAPLNTNDAIKSGWMSGLNKVLCLCVHVAVSFRRREFDPRLERSVFFFD